MMPVSFITAAIFCIMSMVLCFLAGIVTLLFAKESGARRCLGLFYVVLSCAFTITGLAYNGLIRTVPYVFSAIDICWLLCMPLSWLYVRTTVLGKPPGAIHLLHFLPAALYILDELIFLRGPRLMENAHLPIRCLQMAAYWYLQVKLLRSSRASSIRNDRRVFRWLMIFTFLEFFLFLPFLLLWLVGIGRDPWLLSVYPVTAVVLATFIFILNPAVLYGNAPFLPLEGAPRKTLPDARSEWISRTLETFMQQRKPFLDPDYTLRQLAGAIGVSSHQLSGYMNQVVGLNFNEYMNRWRILYCLELIEKREMDGLNQQGVAAKCGFNNRQSFSSAFKKTTGKLPSLYLRSKTG
jgi:AraC-like DNA-binding protein